VQKNKIGKNVQNCPQNYQIATKYTKIGIKIPNGHKEHQNLPSQGLPK
jgi:hypothetical protein